MTDPLHRIASDAPRRSRSIEVSGSTGGLRPLRLDGGRILWLELTLMSEETRQTPKANRSLRAGPTAMALVIGLAALTAQASESELVRDIQRYCTVCWRNARLDPGLWDDCTQEVC